MSWVSYFVSDSKRERQKSFNHRENEHFLHLLNFHFVVILHLFVEYYHSAACAGESICDGFYKTLWTMEGFFTIWNKIQNREMVSGSFRPGSFQSCHQFGLRNFDQSFFHFSLDRWVVSALFLRWVVSSSLCWWSFSLMTITESCERTLPSLSPYIKRQMKI